MSDTNMQVRVVKRASGVPSPDVFELATGAILDCPQGGVVARVLYAAVDPAMRGWLSAESNYLTVPDGAVMRAEGIGEIVQSRSSTWQVGQLAYGTFGWQQYAAATTQDLYWPVDTTIAPAPVWLGTLGFNGLTAWIGFKHLAKPRPGETVLVSTAAGGVGCVVGGLARAAGLRAVGVTGGADKVKRCIDRFGYAAAIDYKASRDLAHDVAATCPEGIDIYFDNTAGLISDAVFPTLKRGARVIQCGTASIAEWRPVPTGPRREREMIVKRLCWQGFVVSDHAALYPVALADLKRLYGSGALEARSDVLHGLASAPAAIQRLYDGRNDGRLCIQL